MTTVHPKNTRVPTASSIASFQTSATRAYMVVDILPGAEKTAFQALSAHPSVESIDVVQPQCFVLIVRGDTEPDLVDGAADVLASAYPWASLIEFTRALVPA